MSKINPDVLDLYKDKFDQFGIGSDADCPIYDGIYDFCQLYSGGSLDAAVRLNHGLNDICINWSGGLHHAKKSQASGFCYVNDIVLAILELLKYFARVLYIDIDVHHGDGVEEAFYLTDRVMTCSFHKYGNYFPGSGALKDIGLGKGKYYAVNIPLDSGIDDENYRFVFEPVIRRIMEVFQPCAIVLQCGADSVTGDRLGCFNLSTYGHAKCVKFVQNFNIPTLVLGGGGYTIRNVARTWAYETSVILNKEIPNDIPYYVFIEWYAPTYQLHLNSTDMENKNNKERLNTIIETVTEHLRHLEGAPSCQIQERPPDWSIQTLSGNRKELENEEGDDREDNNGMDSHVQHPSELYDGNKDNDKYTNEEEFVNHSSTKGTSRTEGTSESATKSN